MIQKNSFKLTFSILFIIAIAAVSVDIFACNFVRMHHANNKRSEINALLNEISKTIQGIAEQNLSHVTGLNAYYSNNSNITEEDFRSFVSQMLSINSVHESFSVTEGFTLKYLYPKDKYLDLIGIDLSKIPQQRSQVLKTTNTRNIVVDGPVELVQKGYGIIARQGYYRNSKFIGMTSTVIELEAITDAVDALTKNRNIIVALRREPGTYIYGDAHIFTKDSKAELVPVTIFNLKWQLGGEPYDGFAAHAPSELYIHLASLLFFLITATLVVYKHQKEHQNNMLTSMLKMSQSIGNMGSFIYNRKKNLITLSEEAHSILDSGQKGKISLDEFIILINSGSRENIYDLLTADQHSDKIEVAFKLESSDKYIMLTAVSFHKLNNEFSGFQGIITDITKQREAHLSLKNSESRFRDLVMCTSDFIWEMDMECRYTYFTGNVTGIHGIPQEKMIGKNPLITDSSENTEFAFFCNTIVKNGLPIKDMEHWVKDINGEDRCFLMNGVPFFDEHGKLKGYRGVDKEITEQNKLRKEREMIFHTSRDGLAIVDDNAKFKSCNKTYLEMTGYGMDELIGKSCLDITHPDDIEASIVMLDELKKQGFYDRFEKRCLRKDGSYIVVQMTLNVMQEDRILVSTRDVTDIKQYQEAIEKNEKMLTSVFNASPIPLCLISRSGKPVMINQAFSDIFKYSLNDIKDMRAWWTVTYPDMSHRYDVKSQWKRYTSEASAGKKPKPIQTVLLCGDGSKRNILFHYSSFDHMGIAAFYDITDRVEAENKLQEYIKLVDRNVPISRTNIMGYITSVSEAFSLLSGYTKTEVVGKRHEMMHHPDMPHEKYTELVDRITEGNIWEGELHKITKNGEPFWTSTVITPIYEHDNLTGFMAIDTDITDKKRIEELSVTDKLTGIYNRIRLDETLHNEFVRFKRTEQKFSVILFDIDFFKKVNDTHGHLVGDEVLKALAKLIKTSVREIDIFGRWGGEEFLIICEDTNVEGAYILASKLRRKVELYEFPTVDTLTCSFGVAEITDAGTDAMVKDADDALYRAKQGGRNRVEKL